MKKKLIIIILKKILFCSRSGLEENNSTGGQLLRLKTSIKSLSKIARVDIVSRNPRFSENIKLNYLKKKKIYYAPSITKTLSKNRILKAIQWRVREIIYFKKDAKFIADLYKKHNYDCVWISYASQSYFLIKQIKKIDKKIKIIADTDSVFFKFIERGIPYSNFLRKIIIFIYSQIYRIIETKMIKISDITTAVSNYDKKTFESINLNKKIFIFRNSIEKKKIIIHKKKQNIFNIIISGTFGAKTTPMNISVDWFLKNIYPILKKRMVNYKIFIVGMNSDKFLQKYNFVDNQLIATGWVKDIKNYFKNADLAVVPLLYESGTRFKILESALYKLPVVSTTLGAEGLPFKNNKSIFLENDPRKFANKIIAISKNKKLLKNVALKSNKIVLKYFSENAQCKDATKILKEL